MPDSKKMQLSPLEHDFDGGSSGNNLVEETDMVSRVVPYHIATRAVTCFPG